jgi:pantoate kinase
MDEVNVQVGGHVTLLFSIHSKPLLSRNQGSRGAGLCLEDGVIASAKVISGDKDIISVTKMDGTKFPQGEALYADLLNSFREVFNVKESIQIDISLELPISQGFGMSAAGLLAASLALGELFDCGDEGQLARLAHRLERQHSGGLGDILGLWAGGCELRVTPGSPPFPGVAYGFDVGCPALLVWDPDGGKHTANYIDNLDWKSKITEAGESAVNRLRQYNWDHNIWETLLEEADNFALESGLLEEKERAKLLNLVLENSDESMSCHLCMLGTSMIVLPKRLGSEIDFGDLSSNLTSLGLGVRETILQ